MTKTPTRIAMIAALAAAFLAAGGKDRGTTNGRTASSVPAAEVGAHATAGGVSQSQLASSFPSAALRVNR
jgi:hypothetical protein